MPQYVYQACRLNSASALVSLQGNREEASPHLRGSGAMKAAATVGGSMVWSSGLCSPLASFARSCALAARSFTRTKRRVPLVGVHMQRTTVWKRTIVCGSMSRHRRGSATPCCLRCLRRSGTQSRPAGKILITSEASHTYTCSITGLRTFDPLPTWGKQQCRQHPQPQHTFSAARASAAIALPACSSACQLPTAAGAPSPPAGCCNAPDCSDLRSMGRWGLSATSSSCSR